MEILALTAIIVGFLIIALLRKRPASSEVAANHLWWSQMESDRHARKLIEVSEDRFQSLCVDLIDRLGLEIVDRQRSKEEEILLVARSIQPVTGGDYLISLYLENQCGGPVPPEKVINLRNATRAHGALKGIFITNTYFPPDYSVDQEGAPVMLINGLDLASLMSDHALI